MANVFSNISEEIVAGVMDAMRAAGSNICDDMSQQLKADGHGGTGALLDSIKYNVTEDNGQISVTVSIADYAKYINSGTGAAHGVTNGRQGSWRYKDRKGQWHTTDGMDADPFIEPAVDDTLSNLSSLISQKITDAIRKGGGSGG